MQYDTIIMTDLKQILLQVKMPLKRRVKYLVMSSRLTKLHLNNNNNHNAFFNAFIST